MGQKVYSYNRYGADLARKKRRRFFLIIGLVSILFFAIVGSLFYFVFFSSYLDIQNIEIKGVKTVTSAEILPVIDGLRKEGYFKGLEPRNNMLFFNAEKLKMALASDFPVLKKIEISKEFPHKLKIHIEERIARGTWCLGEECRYFDDSGALWGKAIKSYGSLLLTIEDGRTNQDKSKADVSFLEPIKEASDNLSESGFKINGINIMPDDIGDFKISITDGYYILFNDQTDISNQINIFNILLKNKGADFKPEYIDLRIDGRIYYK